MKSWEREGGKNGRGSEAGKGKGGAGTRLQPSLRLALGGGVWS